MQPMHPSLTPGGTTASLADGGAFSLPPDTPLDLGAILARTARLHPGHGVCYLDADGMQAQTYPALFADAACILTGLRALGLQVGDPVLFQFQLNQDFIPAFWACVLGGFVPVPVSIAPSYDQPNSTTTKLLNAWSLLDRPATLAGAALAPQLRAFAAAAGADGFRVAAIAELRANPPAQQFHAAAPDDTALLLLTSGSTGMPKAVRQSHRNLISWATSFGQACGITPADRTLNWMPLDHVGGIVFFAVRETVIGAQQFHAPTETALQRPLIWLDWIDRHRITVTWAPNFVFGLVNEYAAEIAAGRWDLSCLRCLLNGGESVASRTARRFLSLLIPHGLPPRAMLPVWGMSETSSGCIFSRRFALETTTDDDPFVEVGVPVPGLQVRITDLQDRILPEGEIGQMQIRGISVTPGYHRNPEATAKSFTADGWFVTGDLATITDGQLAIVGREKDVIIINGVNFYSHEIESIAEEIPGVSVSFTAACAVRLPGDHSDRLAVFFSPTEAAAPHLPQLIRALRATIAQRAGLMPDFVVPLIQADIPKTSLGKIQRSQLKDRFEQGEFAAAIARLPDAPRRPPLFARVWQPAPLAGALPAGSQVLVFTDATPFGDGVVAQLRAAGHACTAIAPTQDPAPLASQAGAITHAILAWSYPVRPVDGGGIDAAQTAGSIALLHLLRTLPAPPDGRKIRLLVVTSQVHAETGPVDFAKAPLLGLVHTIRHEVDWLDASVLDFATPDPAADSARAIAELAGADAEARILDGVRSVPVFRHADAGAAAAAFQRGGFYIVSGGAGGVGQAVMRHLRAQYQARLLILGRSPAAAAADDDIIHAAGDVADVDFVRAAVAAAAARWQVRPAGVIHLAGVYHETLLADETEAALRAAMRPKLDGAWALHLATCDDPDCRFIAFSSLLAQFGAMGTGAYAAANAGLDAFCRHLRGLGRDATAIVWSPWADTGMGRFANPDALQVRGFLMLPPAQGLDLLEQALACEATPILAGLDAASRAIQPHLEPGSVEAGQDGAAGGHVAPRTPTEHTLARMWEDLLGLRQVSVTADFFDLGGRSLLAARLFARIEAAFGRRLPLATLYKAPTIEALAALVAAPAPAAPADDTIELHRIQPCGDKTPFFCIPGVGSDVIAFQDLARELGETQPFYGLQLRGLDGADVAGPAPRVEDVAAGFVRAIRAVQPQGPYLLGGHCFGSLLAWEVARQLQAQGATIGLLALLDPVVSTIFPDDIIQQGRLRYSLQKFLRLDLADKGRFILAKFRNIGRAIVVRQRLGRSIQQARAMHAAYTIGAYPGRIVVFLADDSFFNVSPARDPRRHYESLAAGAQYLPVAGDHDSMLRAPGVMQLAPALQASFAAASDRGS